MGMMVPVSRRLDSKAVTSISCRLAELDSLRLPGQLTRNGDPTLEQRHQYVSALLERDPGVFLERHGDMLSADELGHFEGLRDDYEVDLYLRLLENARIPAANDSTRKNRRLAYMHRLMAEGSYFSTEEMEKRQPWMYHEFEGRYIEQDAAMESQSYAERLLARDREERMTEARQAAQDAAAGMPSGDQQRDALLSESDDDDSDSDARLEDKRLPSQESAEHRHQLLLELMKQQFLAGNDPDVDYEAIDCDADLDEHWATDADRDAEEAYFDA